MKKSYDKDTFNLQEIDLHNAIEHDGSITREYTRPSPRAGFKKGIPGYDVYHEPDQSKVAVDLVDGLLESASGKDDDGNSLLLPKDLSVYSGKRRADARATNPQYTTSLAHRLFGSSK